MKDGDERDQASLERALRAPGSAEELAEQERYVAMFRAARAPAPAAAGGAARTAIRRLGTGGTLAVVFAVASAGVAAAYSRSLPDPVQRAFHSVLAPIGVPPAEPQRQPDPAQARTSAEPTPPGSSPAPQTASATSSADPSEPVAGPSAGPSASTDPSASSTRGAVPSAEPSDGAAPTDPAADPAAPTDTATTAVPATPAATALPSPTGAPSPATSTAPAPPVPTPTTAAPAAAPASVRILSAGADQQVAPGGTAVVAGEVRAADDTPVPGVAVVLQARTDGAWHRISTGRSGEDGSVAVATGPLQQSTSVRLRAGGVTSPAWRLVVQPTLTATVQTHGPTTTLGVSATGGRAGDAVVLLVRRDGALVTEAHGVLDAAGSARFDVATPARLTRYVVRLPATPTHAFAQTRLAVSPPATAPSPTTSPSSSASPSANP